MDKAVSLLALDLSFKVKIGLGTLFFFVWFLFKKIRLLLLRGGPSHTYLLFWRGAVSSRSVISSGNISSCFGPKLFQGQDWSRHTHFLVLAWASSFEGLVQAPYFCFFVLGLFSARCTARPSLSMIWAWVCLIQGLSQAHLSFGFGPGLLQGQGWPRNIHFLGLSQACFIRRIC